MEASIHENRILQDVRNATRAGAMSTLKVAKESTNKAAAAEDIASALTIVETEIEKNPYVAPGPFARVFG
eukprot:2113361-Amphidinium_carterae.1